MLIQKSILKYTSMDYLQDFSIIKVFANTVLIVNETICWAYCMSIRLIGFILFVKYTNCGWGHLLCRLNKRDGLSGVQRTRIEVSHIHSNSAQVILKAAAENCRENQDSRRLIVQLTD